MFDKGEIMAGTFRLILTAGPLPGKEYPLKDKTEFVLGRDLACDIVVNDPEVSRRHARIYTQGDLFYIEDNGSTNGTCVNGQRLMGPSALQSGDRINIGEKIALMFEAVRVDPDATMVSMAKPVIPAAAATIAIPPEAAPVVPEPAAPAAPVIRPVIRPVEPAAPAAGGWNEPAAPSAWPATPEPPAASGWGAPAEPAAPAWNAPAEPEQPAWNAPAASNYPPAAPAWQNPAPPAAPAKKKGFPIWIIIVIALLLIICCCVGTIWAIDANNLWCQIPGLNQLPLFCAQ